MKDEKKATEALAKIKTGEEFGRVAATMSEDQFRVKGGDIGYQHRGKLLPELEKAAFSLKPGEMSGLIKAQNLWFIIKVEDKKPEHQMTFEESKDKLKKELEAKRAKELNDEWMTRLKAKSRIELFLKEGIHKTDDIGQKAD
jgi:parvulin-like peptidyl-prolyl isomerase